MVLKCCICKIQSDDPNGSSISYHKLPAREDLREEWMKVLRKYCSSLTQKYLYVCSDHFEKHCFQYSGMCQRRMLKSGSTPTIFPYFEVVECQVQDSNQFPEPATQLQTKNVECRSPVEDEFQLTGGNIETDSIGQSQQYIILNQDASHKIGLNNKLKQSIRQQNAKVRKLQRQNQNLIIRLGRYRKKFHLYKYLFEALRQTKYISDNENAALQNRRGPQTTYGRCVTPVQWAVVKLACHPALRQCTKLEMAALSNAAFRHL